MILESIPKFNGLGVKIKFKQINKMVTITYYSDSNSKIVKTMNLAEAENLINKMLLSKNYTIKRF